MHISKHSLISRHRNSQDHGRLPDKHISKHSPSYHAETLKITVGCPPCTEPIPARLRQLRVVIQELDKDDVQVVTPRPEPHMSTRPKQKRKVGRKGRLNIASNKKICKCKKMSQVRFFHYGFNEFQKVPHQITNITVYINSKKKTCTCVNFRLSGGSFQFSLRF